MYSIFEQLLKDKKLRVSDVARATGIRASTFTDWKMGHYTPKADKLRKIADFFGVSLEYLTGQDPDVGDRLLLSYEEESIISAYRLLDDGQKDLICKMLGIKRDSLLSKEVRSNNQVV